MSEAPTTGEHDLYDDGKPELFVDGADWETVIDAVEDETLTVNMGPQHPSTHGVLRLVLELDGETVRKLSPIIGYLHTGIEKSTEFRTWVQGTTFVTRMDYLSPLFNEAAYSFAVERLLGIEVPERAQAIRVILMEFNRMASHFVWLATGGMELGSTTVMTYGFREREHILDLFESQSGLRMNHAYIRPGGLAQDVTDDFAERCRALLEMLPKKFASFFEDVCQETKLAMWRRTLPKWRPDRGAHRRRPRLRRPVGMRSGRGHSPDALAPWGPRSGRAKFAQRVARTAMRCGRAASEP
jgi:NADH:ubiquinone oxidoreductase subunit D